MSIKDIATENGIIHIDQDEMKAPIQSISKEDLAPVVTRIKTIVPDAHKMSIEQLTTIAQEAVLFRIVPGRDIHYFVTPRGLQRSPDYKYLKTCAQFKEQMISGDTSATLEESYRALTAEEKSAHGIPENNVAAMCTIVTKRERQQFTQQVKDWIAMGFSTQEAIQVTREIFGELGTSAIGVVSGSASPEGWSPMQKAEKLAAKNAYNRKYGQPTADEMMAMAHRMAARARGEDWSLEHVDQPLDIQARYANLEAIDREVDQRVADMTPAERAESLKRNTDILRGPPDDDFIEAEFSEPDPEPTRPYTPEQLKTRIAELSTQYGNGSPADDALKKKARIALANVSLNDNDTRHRLTEYLTGKQSSNDLTKGEATAIIKWVDTTKDPESGEWLPSGHAVQEAKAVLEHLDEIETEAA